MSNENPSHANDRLTTERATSPHDVARTIAQEDLIFQGAQTPEARLNIAIEAVRDKLFGPNGSVTKSLRRDQNLSSTDAATSLTE